MERERIDALLADVKSYAERHGGKIYAPICHPEFSAIPSEHGPERLHFIEAHLPKDARTALDIGTHWGFFAHGLESKGLHVTAVESMAGYLSYLERLRELYGARFVIFPKSIFAMEGPLKFDVVLALAIFHHFIKTEKLHNQLVDVLSRIDCAAMFFQSHDPKEGQMNGAFRNYAPIEFCEFIIAHSRLNRFQEIARVKNRPLFMLSR